MPTPLLICGLSILPLALGLGLDLSEDPELDSLEAMGRTFLPLALGGAGTGLNATLFAAVAASLASALISLLTLTGLGLVVATNMDKDDKGHSHGGGYGHHSSYRSSDGGAEGMFWPLGIDWESVSLVDWLSILQDTWDRFDPSDLECQKRFICELHQSESQLGPVAHALVHYFSYLKYGEILRLPESLKAFLQEYIDAADVGKTVRKDCGDIFSFCNFSVKDLIRKYSPNHFKEETTPSELSVPHKFPNESDQRVDHHTAPTEDNNSLQIDGISGGSNAILTLVNRFISNKRRNKQSNQLTVNKMKTHYNSNYI